jgi:hypothetical protein
MTLALIFFLRFPKGRKHHECGLKSMFPSFLSKNLPNKNAINHPYYLTLREGACLISASTPKMLFGIVEDIPIGSHVDRLMPNHERTSLCPVPFLPEVGPFSLPIAKGSGEK